MCLNPFKRNTKLNVDYYLGKRWYTEREVDALMEPYVTEIDGFVIILVLGFFSLIICFIAVLMAGGL